MDYMIFGETIGNLLFCSIFFIGCMNCVIAITKFIDRKLLVWRERKKQDKEG
jgi:hypothetical protein